MIASRNVKMVVFILIVLLVAGLVPNVIAAANPVAFPDIKLEAIIRRTINKPSGDINLSDVQSITELDAGEQGITNIEGIQYLSNLQTLYLYDNNISDITPLKGLIKLSTLGLCNDKVSDISALSGLTELTFLSLYNNKVADISALRNLKRLKTLKLANNPIADFSPVSEIYGSLEYKDFNIAAASIAKTNMKVGDYVQFGTYSGKPILWRVISVDDSGSPMLFSEAVLCDKDFDIGNGIANWERSSIRRWLNSSEKAIKPENIYDEQEPGFLSNFTEEEQNAIKLVPRRSILCKESESRDGGYELYKYDEHTTGIRYSQNFQISYSYNEKYFERAYYKIVPDKVCLLSEKEIFDSEKVLHGEKTGDNSYRVFRDKDDDYWLRTPFIPSGGTAVIYVNSGGSMDRIGLLWHNKLGIAPAINLKTGLFVSGNGTSYDPYIPQTSNY